MGGKHFDCGRSPTQFVGEAKGLGNTIVLPYIKVRSDGCVKRQDLTFQLVSRPGGGRAAAVSETELLAVCMGF